MALRHASPARFHYFAIFPCGRAHYIRLSGRVVDAFSISGGILLFVTAVPMLFGQRPASQSAQTNESGPEYIAIFPLAIPLITGPGTITSILLLTAQARGSFAKLAES